MTDILGNGPMTPRQHYEAAAIIIEAIGKELEETVAKGDEEHLKTILDTAPILLGIANVHAKLADGPKGF